MTCYSGNVNAYVQDADENFISLKDFEIVVYTIHDGSRINQTDDFHATIYKNKAGEISANDGFKSRLIHTDDPSLLDLIDWYGDFGPSHSKQYCSDYLGGNRYLECTSNWMLWNISECKSHL